MVCPHAVIRSKIFSANDMADAPNKFKHTSMLGKDFPEGLEISYQVAPEDCTGCALCVDICPIRDKSNASRKALNMAENSCSDALHDLFLELREKSRSRGRHILRVLSGNQSGAARPDRGAEARIVS